MDDTSLIITIDKDLEDLIPGYIENRRRDIASIEAALRKNDFETIRVLGHSMKGSGGGYGFDKITEIGKRIEEAAKVMETGEINRQIAALSEYLSNINIVYE
ncbi:MAG TPA: Hpt domain-containing protein [Syntrophorhabdaceae bacterium]|nr:Hpt domain-containing protein [Syntrophorhabdaceae bacterium]HQM82311.1 Hpt domain-containing protein [Syntrophorhabdaceae bacterium]